MKIINFVDKFERGELGDAQDYFECKNDGRINEHEVSVLSMNDWWKGGQDNLDAYCFRENF